MEYSTQLYATRELIDGNTIDNPEEIIKRDLAKRIISDMKMEDLEKLFTFKKYDPNDYTEESKSKIISDLTGGERLYLTQSQVILFKCSLNIT